MQPPPLSMAGHTYALTATLGWGAACEGWTSGLTSGVFFSAGGTSCQNLGRYESQDARICLALADPVFSACAEIRPLRCAAPAAVTTFWMATISVLTLSQKSPSSSRKYPRPPVIPAATLRPTGPSDTTVPPVMYSQQWSPVPSTTASAMELRTAKRSPARPLTNRRPPVAPYRQVLPTMEAPSCLKGELEGGTMAISPPFMPLPT
mmetsp:Transcript_18872/g.47861  ORF Transcript_18872/g.47861 Transcript_18872/m.47861 type:complete len:206 (-) Transcript_18872:4316-4933(-)